VEQTRREYVCVEIQERGDDLWYDQALTDLGFSVDRRSDPELGAEMQAVMRRYGYRRILALRVSVVTTSCACDSCPIRAASC
jgi:hypothetical protein